MVASNLRHSRGFAGRRLRGPASGSSCGGREGQDNEQGEPPDDHEDKGDLGDAHGTSSSSISTHREVLRMEEEHRVAVSAGPRLAVAQHAKPVTLQAVARGADVSDPVTEVVDAARRMAREEPR